MISLDTVNCADVVESGLLDVALVDVVSGLGAVVAPVVVVVLFLGD